MSIFDCMVRQAAPIFNGLKNCGTTGVTIMYKKYTGQTYDAVTGADKDQYSNTSVSGIETFHNEKSAQAAQRGASSKSDIQIGDRVFIFFSGLPGGESLKDQIKTSDNTVYRVKAITDIRGIAKLITVDG